MRLIQWRVSCSRRRILRKPESPVRRGSPSRRARTASFRPAIRPVPPTSKARGGGRRRTRLSSSRCGSLCLLPRPECFGPLRAPSGGTRKREDHLFCSRVASARLSCCRASPTLRLAQKPAGKERRRSHPERLHPISRGNHHTRHSVLACASRLQEQTRADKMKSYSRLWERCGIRGYLWIAEEKPSRQLISRLRLGVFLSFFHCPLPYTSVLFCFTVCPVTVLPHFPLSLCS
jgi:hypothetical protein